MSVDLHEDCLQNMGEGFGQFQEICPKDAA